PEDRDPLLALAKELQDRVHHMVERGPDRIATAHARPGARSPTTGTTGTPSDLGDVPGVGRVGALVLRHSTECRSADLVEFVAGIGQLLPQRRREPGFPASGVDFLLVLLKELVAGLVVAPRRTGLLALDLAEDALCLRLEIRGLGNELASHRGRAVGAVGQV